MTDITWQAEQLRLRLSFASVPAAPMVQECLRLVQAMAQQRGVALQPVTLSAVAVRADRKRLRQVLLNLLSNAIKYKRVGGSVHVALALQRPDRLRISVSDTGAGIPAARLQELFQPFNRLGQEGSGIEGTGIGLSITRRLIEMMGGTVGVESQSGVGSTFWVALPTVPVALSTPPPAMGACASESASGETRAG